jgi:hypothetical protein
MAVHEILLYPKDKTALEQKAYLFAPSTAKPRV